MNVYFTDEMNPSRAAKETDVLRAPRLWIPTAEDYGPGHKDWLAKVEHELTVGGRSIRQWQARCFVAQNHWRVGQ